MGRRKMTGASVASGGLVPYSTSDTRLTFQTELLRLYRLRRSITATAELFSQMQAGKPAMLTLTYRDDNDWNKLHMTQLVKAIREYLRRKGHPLRYCWVAELTKRGRVHYHLLLWLPKGVTLPKPDKRGWWPHGSTRIEWAKSAVGYLVKYASKIKQKYDEYQRFPKGIRIYGSGGLDDPSRERRAHWMLPAWIREQTEIDLKIRRAPGGGFVSKLTGQWWESPWRIIDFTRVLGVGPIVTVQHQGA